MLVACSLVNLTTWEQARPAHAALMGRYTIRSLAAADPSDLHQLMQPLGLWRRRSECLVKLAGAWLRSRPACAKDVLALPGCGRYTSDSWAIFMDGDLGVEPHDGKLNWYLDSKRGEHGERGRCDGGRAGDDAEGDPLQHGDHRAADR